MVGQASTKEGYDFGILMALAGALRTSGAPAPLTLGVRSLQPSDITFRHAMNKPCKVCSRTCSDDALQCPAGRSSEFVGEPSHIEAYKAAQRRNLSAAELQEIKQQISELSSFPIQLKRPYFSRDRCILVAAQGPGSFGPCGWRPRLCGFAAPWQNQ